jgi:hypothetical protein
MITLYTRNGNIRIKRNTLVDIPYFCNILDEKIIYVDEDQNTMLEILKIVDSKYYEPKEKHKKYLTHRLQLYGIVLNKWKTPANLKYSFNITPFSRKNGTK